MSQLEEDACQDRIFRLTNESAEIIIDSILLGFGEVAPRDKPAFSKPGRPGPAAGRPKIGFRRFEHVLNGFRVKFKYGTVLC